MGIRVQRFKTGGPLRFSPQVKLYPAEKLAKSVNLAADFQVNPFSEAFAKVDAAVAAEQAHEIKQIKQMFHGDAGKADMEGTITRTEAERAPLVAPHTETET